MRSAATRAWQRGLPGHLVSVLFALVAVLETPSLMDQAATPELVPVGTLGLVAAVVMRRRAPRLALATWFVAAPTQAAAVGLTTSTEAVAVWLAIVLVCLAAGRHVAAGRPRRAALLGTVLAGAADVVLIGLTAPLVLGDFVFPFLFTVGPFALGVLAADRAAAAAELHELAALAQEDAGAEERQAVRETRRQIALEMHDVVGHSVSVMLLQAAAARRIAVARPDDAVAALAVLRAAGTEARGELDRLLGVLPAGLPSRMPALSVDADDLLARFGVANLTIRVEGAVPPLEVGPDTDLAAYRVLQESLTNCARHAPGSSVTVRSVGALDGAGWSLEVLSERDPGHVPRPATDLTSGRHGIDGMRERMYALGGTLEAGTTPGGFRVLARFPGATTSPVVLQASSPGTTMPCS